MERTASPPACATPRAPATASGRGAAGRTRAATAARGASGGDTRASAHLPQPGHHLLAQPFEEGAEIPVRRRQERPQDLRAPVDAVHVPQEIHEPPAGPEA